MEAAEVITRFEKVFKETALVINFHLMLHLPKSLPWSRPSLLRVLFRALDEGICFEGHPMYK